MKGITKIISFLLILGCLTGCRKTYLTCTKVVADDQSIKVEETIKLGYKRKKLHTSNIYLDYLFKNNSTDNKESLKKELLNECARYEGMDGVECSVYNVEDKIRLDLNIVVDEIKEEEKATFEEMLNYGNYTDSFKRLEKEYYCK